MYYYSFSLAFLLAVNLVYGAEKCIDKNIQWTGGSNFEWPSSTTKIMYKTNGKYISKNVIATRAAIHKDDVFLALPRYRQGVPMTLAKLNVKGKNCHASLTPFPSWTMQEEGNCDALQSVIDIFLDPHGILWVLDSGIVNSLEQPAQICLPKVVAINVRTGKVVKVIDVSHLTNYISRLQYIIADYSADGRVFVYLSDAANRAIIVYDVTSGRGYRVILPNVVTRGCNRPDVLYLALIKRSDGTNSVFFTYLSSKYLFSIKSVYLQSGSTYGKVTNLGPKRDNVVFLGTDNKSSLFFRKEGEPDVYRWDLLHYPQVENIEKVYKGNSYALPTQVMSDYKRGKMRLLESNFPDYLQGTVGCGVNHALNTF